MVHFCQFCRRAFNRKFNRIRHEAVSCPKRFDGEEEEMTSLSNEEENLKRRTETYEADNTQENGVNEDLDEDEDDGDDDDDDDDDENESESNEETDEDEQNVDSDTENETVDPWEKLREEVIDDLNSAQEEQVEEYLRQGLSKDDAQAQASNLLLPVYRKKLRHLYLHYLRWYHNLKTDSVHRKVMKTLRNFMEDDEMEYTEAVEAAVSKRKYLLNSLFDLEDITKETSTDDDNVTFEARKRKFYEPF